jgi:hypothetical protein
MEVGKFAIGHLLTHRQKPFRVPRNPADLVDPAPVAAPKKSLLKLQQAAAQPHERNQHPGRFTPPIELLIDVFRFKLFAR